MKRESVQLTISLPPQLYKKAMQFARKEVYSKSELVRQALREFLSKTDSEISTRQELSRVLQKRGIRNLEDLEDLIDEGRK